MKPKYKVMWSAKDYFRRKEVAVNGIDECEETHQVAFTVYYRIMEGKFVHIHHLSYDDTLWRNHPARGIIHGEKKECDLDYLSAYYLHLVSGCYIPKENIEWVSTEKKL